MKVSIDRKECTSCALCWSDCPDIFEEDPKDGCPVSVIHVE
ncbi:MAG: ferredoxin [Spirochaetia bacterium]